MKKIARNDWKRHSAPHEITFELTEHVSSVDEVFDQAMDAFTENTEKIRASTIGRERKNTLPAAVLTCDSLVELSTDEYAPGVLKIYGETVVSGVQYKSVLASCRSTALELVKQALERYGLPPQYFKKFVLCDVIGNYVKAGGADDENTVCERWERIYARVLSDKDKPLLMQKFWKPLDGCSRRYELHKRAHLIDLAETDDTSGLNSNARKILISKLRPGAIPLFDPSQSGINTNGLIGKDVTHKDYSVKMSDTDTSSAESSKGKCICRSKSCTDDKHPSIPVKHPFFLNIRGYDISKDKVIYPVKYKKFTFGNPNARNQMLFDDVPKIPLLAPDIEGRHCDFKVYKFKRTNGVKRSEMDQYNYFLEMEPLGNNIRVNGHKISGKSIVKSGDILNIGIYYVFVFKDCSRNSDIPLALPWLPISEIDPEKVQPRAENCDDLQLHLFGDDESKSNTDESMEVSIPEKMALAYKPDKEEELVKYICAIIQQPNSQRTYPLTVSFLFSMCVEYASRKFDRRQLKHLFLRILFNMRENVAGTAKSLSASKFSCNLLETGSHSSDGDQKLDRLLLWVSNCVQLLLFLKHTFQLSELPATRQQDKSPRREQYSNTGLSSPRREDNAKHALSQLVTGLEEIIMFCFQQSVYTLTKALHPSLSALLDSNPFSDINSEQCSMEDITRMYGALAEVTHAVMLHEGITRQLFTYLFFFTSTNVFNKLMMDENSSQYYNWASGVRIRANLGQLEDWATQNGLEDEFGQMFERLLAASELLATSKNTLVKYEWGMMKDHYQPLSAGQIHHILKQYQLGTRDRPSLWVPSDEELIQIENEEPLRLTLCNHPPFALPDNCGVIDLMRVPEDATFWNHLKRLKSLYGIAEDDSDSGFSRSNTPHGTETSPTEEIKTLVDDPGGHGFRLEGGQLKSNTLQSNATDSQGPFKDTKIRGPRSRMPVKKSNTNPWTLKVPKSSAGVCNCATFPRSPPHCMGCKYRGIPGDGNTNVAETLMSDLMFEERRESTEDPENQTDTKVKAVNAILKKTADNANSIRDVSIERTERFGSKTLSRSSAFKSNVSNVSVRNTNTFRRERSNTVGNSKELISCLKKKPASQSVSLEDVNLPFMYRKPILSASFYEAIERGYENKSRRSSNVSSASSQLGNISEHVQNEIERLNNDANLATREHTSNLSKLRPNLSEFDHNESQSRNETESLSDDVFAEESLDQFYRKNVQEINTTEDYSFLPESNTFKPISTSTSDNRRTSSQSQKLLAISFDAGSHSSAIELAQNTLYVSGVNEIVGNQNVDVIKRAPVNEKLTEGMFVEVNEDVLASRKRHGSSINVVPNSPRLCIKQELKPVNIDTSEQKQVVPCPLFTVYLRKTDRALGLGLIDGLHTPLRLTGIYIKKILPGSPAALNGCLQVGDRILAVNGTSVIGANYQSTMKLIRAADDALTLLVARGNDSVARKISSSNV